MKERRGWRREGCGQPAPITRYRRPLAWHAARPREAGPLIDTLDEPLPDAPLSREPSRFVARRRVAPSFLILGAQKPLVR